MTNLIEIIEGNAVTTTLAIAEGTENQHKNVLSLVRTYLVDLQDFGRVAFETRTLETAGGVQNQEIATLNEQQATLLLTYMRNSVIVRQFKRRLVKEFYDMANKLKHIDPMEVLNDPAAMRGLLLTYTEKVLALQDQVAELEPKAEALGKISESEGDLNITNAAKVLNMPPKKLFSWLNEHHWIYKRAGGKSWVGYQDRIQNGLLKHKVTTLHLDDGTDKLCEQVLLTPKGLIRLSSNI